MSIPVKIHSNPKSIFSNGYHASFPDLSLFIHIFLTDISVNSNCEKKKKTKKQTKKKHTHTIVGPHAISNTTAETA